MKICSSVLLLFSGRQITRLSESSKCIFVIFVGNAPEGRKVKIIPVAISRKEGVPEHLSEANDVLK